MVWKFVLPLGAIVVILAAVLYLNGQTAPQSATITTPPQETQQSAGSTPETVPQKLTPENVDQTLGQTDSTIQSDLTQMDQNLEQLDQVPAEDNLNTL